MSAGAVEAPPGIVASICCRIADQGAKNACTIFAGPSYILVKGSGVWSSPVMLGGSCWRFLVALEQMLGPCTRAAIARRRHLRHMGSAMSEEFYRIKRLPPYVIAEVNNLRHAARQAGRDIIDLGMGNPDLPPPQHVIDKLCEVAMKPDAHGYSQSRGIPGLRRAQANYYGRRFGVEVDPEREVVVTMGSKEGLASLATAITAPGDVVLAPNPSYPIHTFGFIIAGATIRSVPTTPDDNYFRSLERAMAFTVPRPSILVVNYPSNPTAETVGIDFYERLVAWARENKVWVISDLAYSELYYDGNPTVSILQVPGAKDVAVEFTSMSKTFSMAGWRVGFAVGNTKLIAALKRVKSYLDYGAFTPIQA